MGGDQESKKAAIFKVGGGGSGKKGKEEPWGVTRIEPVQRKLPAIRQESDEGLGEG